MKKSNEEIEIILSFRRPYAKSAARKPPGDVFVLLLA
jgi:hypothetical protein